MVGVGNAVGSGFAKSISQPGGNITGLTNDSIEVSSKYLEYLRAAVPNLMRVGVLIDPKHPNHPTILKQVQVTAKAIGASVSTIELRSVSDIDPALRLIHQGRLDALIIPPDPTFPIIYRQITEFAISNRLPTMFGQRRGVEAGGLMAYEPSQTDMYKRAAALVDKILKGAKSADLPVEFPTRFELIINLKTAKTLGLTVPPALLTSSDEVSASLIGRLGSSGFRPSTTAVSIDRMRRLMMSLTGSCFSTASAHRPFHHGIRRRGGTIFWAALPAAGPSGHTNSPHPSSREGDTIPLLGGVRVSS
jgi:ABC transporter substrate binding protein